MTERVCINLAELQRLGKILDLIIGLLVIASVVLLIFLISAVITYRRR